MYLLPPLSLWFGRELGLTWRILAGEAPSAPSCPEYLQTGEESPGVVWATHQPQSRTLWFPRQPLIASLFFTSGLCDRSVMKQTQRWRFVFRFPGKSSWEQHPWECEGGRTGQSEELGCDTVTAKASATAQEIWIRDGSAGSPTWVEGRCSLHCVKNKHKEEGFTLELSAANILHSWETEVGHTNSTVVSTIACTG